MPARTLLMAQPAAAGGGAFDPETDITWHSLFWAEGTGFTALGYSDTNTVTSWPNETAETDAAGTGFPVYDASHASFNSQPVVAFDGTNDYLQTGAFSSNPSYTSGVSIVVIAKSDSLSAVSIVIDGLSGVSQRIGHTNATKWRIGAGTNVDDGTADTNPHLFIAQFDGSTGADTLDVDGTQVITGSAGSNTLTGVTIGANNIAVARWPGPIALVGIYEGDITADGSWADFETWVSDHYGITIA